MNAIRRALPLYATICTVLLLVVLVSFAANGSGISLYSHGLDPIPDGCGCTIDAHSLDAVPDSSEAIVAHGLDPIPDGCGCTLL